MVAFLLERVLVNRLGTIDRNCVGGGIIDVGGGGT